MRRFIVAASQLRVLSWLKPAAFFISIASMLHFRETQLWWWSNIIIGFITSAKKVMSSSAFVSSIAGLCKKLFWSFPFLKHNIELHGGNKELNHHQNCRYLKSMFSISRGLGKTKTWQQPFETELQSVQRLFLFALWLKCMNSFSIIGSLGFILFF